jgi:hypothetical protein
VVYSWLPAWNWSKRVATFLPITIRLRGFFVPAARMALTSQGAGRKVEHPWKEVGALIAGIDSAAISAAEFADIRASMSGLLMSMLDVIKIILMITTVAFLLVQQKQAYLFAGQRGVPPMFLKLWSTAMVFFAFAASTMLFASLVMNKAFSFCVVF